MRPTILFPLFLGGCAGLAFAALSLRASRPDPSLRGPDAAKVGAPHPTSTEPSVPAPPVPPFPPSSGPRKPASPLTARVALGGFVRKVVWEPDRGEPIRGAVVRVVLSAPTGPEVELGRCVTDERGAFAFEAELPFGRLPTALRLWTDKEGWAEAWSVPGLPLAIDSLPHASVDLVCHMARAGATVDPAGSRADGSSPPRQHGLKDGTDLAGLEPRCAVFCQRTVRPP